MFKWLQKFKIKKVTSSQPSETASKPKNRNRHFYLEIRIDEKGLVYHPSVTIPYLESDPEGYSEVCQAMASIALTEMREKNRVIH